MTNTIASILDSALLGATLMENLLLEYDVMPTKTRRLNITLDPRTASILHELAGVEQKSLSNIANELITDALERREDMLLSLLADARDVPNAKKVSHDHAWK